MPQQQIMCTVNTCHYWKQGNRCDANQILVISEALADRLPDSADAVQASTMNTTPVSNCMETCCKSFVHKDSSAQNLQADGITRL